MKNVIDFIAINKQSWNSRTDVHYNSEFYNNDEFIKGKSSLNKIELDLLGDIKGKSILHLQCHFGQDTISLNRLGAAVTGVDLSDKSIERAKELSAKTKSDCKFICCDLYELPKHLNEKYDIVFTSYGTISWLPDLNKWAAIIEKFLKPESKFIFVEFHPVVWMFDDDFKEIKYNYFNSGPIVESESGTYADKKAPINQDFVNWNHSIGEVIGSLIKNGLKINSFEEIDYSPYNCFNNAVEFQPGKFRINHFGNKIPMVFSIVASKTN